MSVFLIASLAHVRSGPFQFHVDTNEVGVIGDTLLTYGAVEGFSALVVGGTEYEIREGFQYRLKRGTPHAVIGGGKREVFAIDEVTGLEVGDDVLPCPDTFSCCSEYKVEVTGSVTAHQYSTDYSNDDDGSDIEVVLTGIEGVVKFDQRSGTNWIVTPDRGGLHLLQRAEGTGTTILCPSTTNQCTCPEDFAFINTCENISMSCHTDETGSEFNIGAIIGLSVGAVLLVLIIVVGYKNCKRDRVSPVQGSLL